jgi:hypothetical protein
MAFSASPHLYFLQSRADSIDAHNTRQAALYTAQLQTQLGYTQADFTRNEFSKIMNSAELNRLQMDNTYSKQYKDLTQNFKDNVSRVQSKSMGGGINLTSGSSLAAVNDQINRATRTRQDLDKAAKLEQRTNIYNASQSLVDIENKARMIETQTSHEAAQTLTTAEKSRAQYTTSKQTNIFKGITGLAALQPNITGIRYNFLS